MRDKVREAIFAAGFGPLCEQNPPAGGPGPDPATGGTGTPPAAGGGGGGAPAPAEDRSNWIPRDRFDQVNGEYQRLKKAEDDRAAEDMKKKGEYESLAQAEKAKREAAEQRAVNIAKRAAFIGAAAGKVVDAEAAFIIARDTGLLGDLDVDDDGNPKDRKKLDSIVDELVKARPFLKAGQSDRSFGGDRSGANGGGQPALDPNKASARDLMRAGYDAIGSSGTRRG